MGARDHGEKRKQHTARCLPRPNSNNLGSSGSSNSVPAVTEETNTGVLKLKEACDRGRVTPSRQQRARLPSLAQR